MSTFTHAVVNPATGAVTTPGTYNQTVVAAPTKPSTTSKFDIDTNAPMIRELVVNGTVMEPQLSQEITAASSFFTGDQLIKSRELLNNLKFGQEIKLIIEKDQNPLSLFNKKAVAYKDVDTCHVMLDLDCEMPCVNTLPEFDYLKFRFDCEYSYGVRACDKNTDFWDLGYFTKQYAKSRAGMQFGREIDLWNTVIRGLIASPAITVDAKLAEKYPTHFWADQGAVATNARCVVPMAYNYMIHNIAGVNPTVFIDELFGTELIASVETPYNLNFATQRVNTFQQWTVPGFTVNEAVRQILGGIPVVVMKRSPWLTYTNSGSGSASGAAGLVSQFPLWNEDASKQYVAILDPKVGYRFEKDGYHLVIRPYDCDKLDRGMQDSLYQGSGITFPILGLIIEFDAFEYCA